MGKHDFIPLATFRGYTTKQNSKDKNDKQVFGYLEYVEKDGEEFFIIKKHYYAVGYQVDKDSIGIYTGKNDKTKWEDRPKEYLHIPKEEWKGVPIFCGVAGAKYGSDILDDGDGPFYIVFGDDLSFYLIDENSHSKEQLSLYELSYFPNLHLKAEVTGNQYEQHLKDQQCSKQK